MKHTMLVLIATIVKIPMKFPNDSHCDYYQAQWPRRTDIYFYFIKLCLCLIRSYYVERVITNV